MIQKQITVALAGNPNSGKTSFFNGLTGSRQHVGNWPGVTVEKKEGLISHNGYEINVIDLPGTYSLGAYSDDEKVVCDYLYNENPDVIVNVIDSTNIERNLYLTIQILEFNPKIVIALNMFDELKNLGVEIDIKKLSSLLNTPIVPTIALKKQGLDLVIEQAILKSNERNNSEIIINYGNRLEEYIKEIKNIIDDFPSIAEKYNARWLAIKLLDGDANIIKMLQNIDHGEKLLLAIKEIIKNASYEFDNDIYSKIVEKRYEFISNIISECVTRKENAKTYFTEKIDKVITNKFLGIPIFLSIMMMVFQLTFKLGDPLIGLIEKMFSMLGEYIAVIMSGAGISDMLISLTVDGVIGGVGSVLVFIPIIFILFFCISILEDIGYMSRAAYVMDRLMRYIGLHGKTFISFIIGFGCNVPSIMSTRTLENRKDKMISILVLPLMSCAARLPVYVLFAGALFSRYKGLAVFSMYLLGILLAIIMAKIFSKLFFKGESSTFIMELTPYRIPSLKNSVMNMWENGSSFIKKAGTIILASVILIWVLSSLPVGVEYASNESIIGRIGSMIAWIFEPAGFGNWQASVALIFGVLAKEIVIGTLGVVYGVGEEGLISVLPNYFTPLSAYSFMVMTLIYTPCVATVAAIKRETNSWKWTIFSVIYSLVLGWFMAVMVYQGGKLFGLV